MRPMSKDLHMLPSTAIEDRLEAGRLEIDIHLQEIIEKAIAKGHAEVAKLAGQVLLAGGKRMRPLLILLAHEVAGGTDRDQVIPLALAFELIHTATLVHDDINDKAKQRRGVPTIHERAGSEKAMIAGDWLFVQGFALGGRYDATIVELNVVLESLVPNCSN